jgi:hypothetical protein
MVKVQDFRGAVFDASNYEQLLHSNIEHLEPVPMSSSFSTADMLAKGMLHVENEPFFYVYRQHYLQHTSLGILA